MTRTAAVHLAPPGGCSPEGCCDGKTEVPPALLQMLALCSPGTPFPANPPRPGPRLTAPPPQPAPPRPAAAVPPHQAQPVSRAQPHITQAALPRQPHPSPPSPFHLRRNSWVAQCFESTIQPLGISLGFITAAPPGLEQRLTARTTPHSPALPHPFLAAPSARPGLPGQASPPRCGARHQATRSPRHIPFRPTHPALPSSPRPNSGA